MEGINEDDAAVLVFKKEFMTVEGLGEFGVVENQMRSLGAADELRMDFHFVIDEIDPRASGVD